MKKIVTLVISSLVIIGLFVLVIKLIGGALGLVSGLFNAILGIAVVLALVAIVIWMFKYAAKGK